MAPDVAFMDTLWVIVNTRGSIYPCFYPAEAARHILEKALLIKTRTISDRF